MAEPPSPSSGARVPGSTIPHRLSPAQTSIRENIDKELYFPQVADDQKPKSGMNFPSMDEAFLFYNQYARESGFSARMSKSKKDKVTKEIIWKQFVCFKEGHTDETRSGKRVQSGELKIVRSRGEVRTDCKAKISLVKQQTGSNWCISSVVEGHNHPLCTPTKVHLLRSHRGVSTVKKALTQQFSEANIPTCQQMRLLEIEYGGPEHVGFTERDLRNQEQEQRDEHKGIDAETLIEFFTSEKEKNSTFFLKYETDSENRLSRCFWANSTSRSANSVFGDAVVFDSTYNTNKYAMIFAPFVGVNHHHQTIILCCGLLSDEKTESYIWLLNTYIEAMPKGAPKVIITDQDPPLTRAIAQVLPQTVHRYCLWHILNKFSEKLGPVTYRDHYKSMKEVIENSTSPEEFEQSWNEVMRHANLEHDKWLTLMYALRHMWVPIYFRPIFCAGMSSSQRSESSHSFFKRYVSDKNSLMDFITRFNRALRHQRHNELVADHIDKNEHPRVKTNWPMETQMVKVYTKINWMEFQSQVSQSHGYFVQETSTMNDIVTYNVIRSQGISSSKRRLLTHDTGRDYISCSCFKFEFEGIPCRHMLAFLRIKQVFQLPDKYILKRWTQKAKIDAIYATNYQNISDNPQSSLVSRHSRLSTKVSVLVDDASLTDEGTQYFEEQLDSIRSKIKEMNIGLPFTEGNQRRKNLDKAHNINDPSGIRPKGCGTSKRMKPAKERSSKGRICHGCGLRGVSHDKRNCPKNLQDGSNVDDHNNDDNETNEHVDS